jgi:hypothetical protein
MVWIDDGCFRSNDRAGWFQEDQGLGWHFSASFRCVGSVVATNAHDLGWLARCQQLHLFEGSYGRSDARSRPQLRVQIVDRLTYHQAMGNPLVKSVTNQLRLFHRAPLDYSIK